MWFAPSALEGPTSTTQYCGFNGKFSTDPFLRKQPAPMLDYLRECSRQVESALKRRLPRASESPSTIHKAMRYSLFAGGKRLRPALCYAAAEACGGDAFVLATPPACAVECIHTYSLIHDDLPCMDNDDLRRGRPTSHKVFGEGIAVLAGDALLTQAFEILCDTKPTPRYSTIDYVRELAIASGSRWLIAGQVKDMEAEGGRASAALVRDIHLRKTAAMVSVSLRLGAMAVNATPRQLAALGNFGRALGLAFQAMDDILDVTQTGEKLGKTAGKDLQAQKATLPAALGMEKARKEAARLTAEAHAALSVFGTKGRRLHELADYLLQREA